MNIIEIAGNLGADPEVRFTSSGQKVTSLRVASKVRKGGKDDTIWWKVTVWGDQHDKFISFLKKGSAIMVMGDLDKPEIFTDREGKPQISMSITAFKLMFSPFGSGKQEKSEEVAKVQSPVQKEEDPFAGFEQGLQPVNNNVVSDDETPF